MLRKLMSAMILMLAAVCMAAGQAGAGQAAAGKRPFTFEDLMALSRLSAFTVSPDGNWVLMSVVNVSLADNKKTPHLWVVASSGGEPRQLTSDAAGEDRGQFSPDGKRVLMVSSRDGSAQVWTAGFDTASGALAGDWKKLPSISGEAGGALWSPDGRNILFVSDVYPDCKDDLCNQQRDAEKSSSKVRATIFTSLLYRHWTSYTRYKRSHLFVVPAAGGTPRDLTPGDHDVPPFSLGGQDDYAFSPDGAEVAFTSNLDEVGATSTNNDVFIVPAAGGAPRKISTSPGSDSSPMYSPDGKYISFRTQQRAGYESDRFRLAAYERSSGKISILTEDFDNWVGTTTWAPDSQRIYFASEVKGESPVFSVPVAGGKVEQAIGDANDDLIFLPHTSVLLFSRVSMRGPAEIYRVDLTAGTKPALQAITHINDAVLAAIDRPILEPFWFTGSQKAKVQGFIVRPPGFDAAKKYPVKFLIHGGPQGAWGDSWSYRWNPMLFAANGYVVVMINPRGSIGYGQRFIDDINGDWGGRAYEDLMTGLTYAEVKYPFIDKDRECALGASYGGYMANWILGHTQRFRCIVSHDGLFNTESAYGTTEELWFNEWEFKGTPWTNRALYRKWSPHLFAQNFKTPTLVVHGQLDYRLDVSEGFQLFTTLQRLKVPSKMLYFPDEGHWVLKPQNSRLWYKTVNGWVDQYLKP